MYVCVVCMYIQCMSVYMYIYIYICVDTVCMYNMYLATVFFKQFSYSL